MGFNVAIESIFKGNKATLQFLSLAFVFAMNFKSNVKRNKRREREGDGSDLLYRDNGQ